MKNKTRIITTAVFTTFPAAAYGLSVIGFPPVVFALIFVGVVFGAFCWSFPGWNS